MSVANRQVRALLSLLVIALLMMPGVGLAASPGDRVTLSGLVTSDDGRPLPGAMVEVYYYGGGLVGTTNPGAGGHFTLSVPAGAERLYWVRAWAQDYETGEQVWVSRGDTLVRLSLAALYGTVSGRVEGPDRAPVAGARVELVHPDREVLVTTTTRGGSFQFSRVLSGEGYSLRVSARDLTPAVVAVGQVQAGRETDRSVTLRAFRGQVEGTVVDAGTGLAVPGAIVSVEQVGTGEVAEAVTAANGSFTAAVPAVEGAAYRVHVHQAGYNPSRTEPFSLDENGRSRLNGERRVELSRATTDVVVRLLDSDGDPLPGAPVWLEQQGVGIIATGTTEKDGTFRWAGVPTGDLQYRVQTVPPETWKEYTHHMWKAAATDWVTPAAGGWLNLSLELTKGQLHDYGPGELWGRVTGLSNTPIAGATVELIQVGKGVVATTETLADGTYRFTEVEANQSSETFMGRPARETGNGYVVRVSRSDYFPAASREIDLVHRQQAVVDLTLTHLRATAVVHVVDPNGLPVEGAAIRLIPSQSGEPARGVTGGDGTGRVQTPGQGTYWLEVEREGYRTGLGSPLVLEAGRETVLDLTVAPETAVIHGQITDSYGRPVTRPLTVSLITPEGTERTERLQADGSYEISGIAPGTPVLVSVKDEAAVLAASTQVQVISAANRVRVDMKVVQSVGVVSGRILDGAGNPASGAVVELWRSGDGRVALTRSGADGTYRFADVPAMNRRYAVRASLDGYGYRQAGNKMPPLLFLLTAGSVRYEELVITGTQVSN